MCGRSWNLPGQGVRQPALSGPSMHARIFPVCRDCASSLNGFVLKILTVLKREADSVACSKCCSRHRCVHIVGAMEYATAISRAFAARLSAGGGRSGGRLGHQKGNSCTLGSSWLDLSMCGQEQAYYRAGNAHNTGKVRPIINRGSGKIFTCTMWCRTVILLHEIPPAMLTEVHGVWMVPAP